MAQELGETTDEMLKADEKDVQEILNRRPNGNYYIVIHHRSTKIKMDTGEQVIMRLVKDYDKKPQDLLGTVVMEVKNGEIIDTKINLHDAPIAWEDIESQVGLITTPYAQQRRDLNNCYLYNK